MVERATRRRLRELQRRRGKNVNHDRQVRAAWERCRALSLAYLDAVIAVHASGCPGSVPGWGKYARLSPAEQVVRRDADFDEWVRCMEDTPWFPGRSLGQAELERIEDEIFDAWAAYAFQARACGEPANCAGFDVDRARLFRDGATAVGFAGDTDDPAQLMDGGVDLSGTRVDILLPPEAYDVLGRDWASRNPLPKIELRNRLIPDWESPGYWMLKDNRSVTAAELADLLDGNARVTDAQRRALRGEAPLTR